MLPAETAGVCEECGQPADYCDSVPDARVPGQTPSECGYRLKPICWLHAVERRMVATSRVDNQLVADGVGHLDRDCCGGDCLCEICGRKYYDHRPFAPHPFLTLLCDGSVVKL